MKQEMKRNLRQLLRHNLRVKVRIISEISKQRSLTYEQSQTDLGNSCDEDRKGLKV